MIHLGHDRSVDEVVRAALEEDVHGVAISSYQGGHVEYLTYLVERLREEGLGHVKVYAGGGGVIVRDEIELLESRGVAKVFSPDDGRAIGLQGMIDEMLEQSSTDLVAQWSPSVEELATGSALALARTITALELGAVNDATRDELRRAATRRSVPVLGITGTGGSGKSSLTDELVRRFRIDQEDKLRIAIIAVDPTRRRSGGALLGDRIRMNSIDTPHVYFRSLATRDAATEIPPCLPDAIAACAAWGADFVIVETPGIGQGDSAVTELADISLFVMTPEYGAATQLEKIDMLDFADVVAINKFERRGADDALRSVRRQVVRNRERFHDAPEDMPVFGTVAARFNDDGVTALYQELRAQLAGKGLVVSDGLLPVVTGKTSTNRGEIVPGARARYLADIAELVRSYHATSDAQADAVRARQHLRETERMLAATSAGGGPNEAAVEAVAALRAEADARITRETENLLAEWDGLDEIIAGDDRPPAESLSGTIVPRLARPHFEDDGERLALAARGAPARPLPLHRRRVPVPPGRRGPRPHVRRRGWPRPHQPALPHARRGSARHAPLHRVRLRHPLRRRPRRASRHLREDRQLRRVDRHARRHEDPLLGLRPLRPVHVGVDDDQRPRAHDPRHVPQHRDRPAARPVPRA